MKKSLYLIAAGTVLLFFFSCTSKPRVFEVPPADTSVPRIPKEKLHEPFVPEEPEVEAEYEEKTVYKIRPENGHITENGAVWIEEIAGGNGPETVLMLLESREIDRADTKWYAFILSYNGFSKKIQGKKSIPYVRGSRSLWWNEIRLHLDEPLQGTLEITVIDDYADGTYRFTVEKMVERIPPGGGEG